LLAIALAVALTVGSAAAPTRANLTAALVASVGLGLQKIRALLSRIKR